MKKTIKFDWGTEKQIKVSHAGRRDSLFYESYRQALAGVVEIVLASSQYTHQDGIPSPVSYQAGHPEERLCLELSDYHPQKDKIFYNYPNNMIVFSGERGTGKSSALLTFVDGLKRRGSEMFSEDFLQDMIRCELPAGLARYVSTLFNNTNFCSIPPIDPTMLYDQRQHDGHQILTVILSRIYHMAEEAWDRFETRYLGNSRDKQEFINRKNELLKLFSTCYKHISILCGGKSGDEEMDELELLDTMGDTVCLKQELAELVERVLKFCFPQKENSFLIIQIDDSDMNIRYAYDILEDMRRYLMVPRVIIIMAADLNQLTRLVENSFCDNSYSKEDFRELAHNLANQYITKLFPATRQVWLPSLSVYFKEYSENTEIVCSAADDSILPDKSEIYTDSQDQIFRLIYRKTGMIFLKTKGRLHFIIPDNMRLLSHLLAMLSQMDNVADPDIEDYGLFAKEGASAEEIHSHIKCLYTRLYNVQRFRDYFFSVWVNNTLLPGHAQILSQLDRTNSGNKVKYIFEKLKDKEQEEQKLEDVTFADLLGRLDDLDKRTSDIAFRKYYYAVRQYFSFLGHCLMLQELITYYEAVEKDMDKLNEGCTFLALYPVFGSDAFVVPYLENSGNIEWEAEIDQSGEVTGAEPAVSYLVSMLTDYQPPHGTQLIKAANLNYSIVNCLYIMKSSPKSENSRRAFKGAALSIANNENKLLKLLRWEQLQSSSLMALINWDVMRRIRYTLAEILSLGFTITEKQVTDLNDLLTQLQNYYIRLADRFNKKSETPDSYISKYPHHCLRSMEFGKWVIPLFLANTVLLESQETQDVHNLTSTMDIESAVLNFFKASKKPK